jgi:hypothetical protein
MMDVKNLRSAIEAVILWVHQKHQHTSGEIACHVPLSENDPRAQEKPLTLFAANDKKLHVMGDNGQWPMDIFKWVLQARRYPGS